MLLVLEIRFTQLIRMREEYFLTLYHKTCRENCAWNCKSIFLRK